MTDDSLVARETVIKVLRSFRVCVSEQEDGPPNMMVLVQGETLEARVIPKRVGRRMLQYLARRYSVPIHIFYHPEMIPAKAQAEDQPRIQ